jgi:hypothetical protein
MTIGGAAAIGVAIVAGGIFEGPRLFKRRAKGAYAELVNLLNDPDQAAVVGRAIHLGESDPPVERLSQTDLKQRLKGKTLSTLVAEDSGYFERMVEAEGWVIPLALAEVCILAAESV